MASMDLGRLDLVSTTSGLRLDLSSRAQFTTPAGNLTNECRATPPSDEEGWGRCWIERANNFRLVLGLRLGDGLHVETKDNVLATLADRIGHAELWQQLCLSATSVETTASDATGLSLVTISLAHCEQDTAQQRKHRHKLGVGVPFYEVRPPAGIRTRALESVYLAMDVAFPAEHKRPKLSNAFELQLFTGHLQSTAGLEIGEDIADLCGPDSESDFDDLLFDNCDSPEDSASCEVRYLPASPAVDTRPAGFDSPATSLKRSSSLAGSEPADIRNIQADSVLALVDAGLRLAISDKSKRLGKDLRVHGGKRLKRLRDVAPALWSPGYLTTVADRAIFLPTISHALSSVASKVSHSAHLGWKVAKLCPADTSHERSALSAHLWRLLQEGEYMYPSKSTARLKPLFGGTQTVFGHDTDGPETFEPSRDLDEQFVEYDDDLSEFEESSPCEDLLMYDDDLLDSMLQEDLNLDGDAESRWTPLAVEEDILEALLDSADASSDAGSGNPFGCTSATYDDRWAGPRDENIVALQLESAIEDDPFDKQRIDDPEAETWLDGHEMFAA
ncbi:hypothetical protein LTR91_000208 [Friedmanniomyces endolithicus]|uniref:Uncharacterized protein n=2 Tax=Friedmanniomyces endolithicus TaxID=329885 RepID=A0AAN6L2K0_9PEZI|nr:hypothetical protein LTS09_008428 [Friedmanniomyces endolithicus]KAK0281198.1 hypothetical protein LTR35_007573 [Friedmanniomyces endolithicus]KAK0295160.1 hypothetical protein LTS00_006217 [Friedmanniomyces endolithicus]KAK0313886.1 hypothetical protein LTR01_002143 [Friedmanniomyces endolithicus]KAK0317284.1 hypothetical protein LTR82_011606 [Friedmanniomyces endolithicus]